MRSWGWSPHDRISALIRRVRDTKGSSLCHVRIKREGSCLQASSTCYYLTHPVYGILLFNLPSLWYLLFNPPSLLFNPPSLWYVVIAAELSKTVILVCEYKLKVDGHCSCSRALLRGGFESQRWGKPFQWVILHAVHLIIHFVQKENWTIVRIHYSSWVIWIEAASLIEQWNSFLKAQLKHQLGCNTPWGWGAALQDAVYTLS